MDKSALMNVLQFLLIIILAFGPPFAYYLRERNLRIRSQRLYEIAVEYGNAFSTLDHWRSANPGDFPDHPEAQLLIKRIIRAIDSHISLVGKSNISPEKLIARDAYSRLISYTVPDLRI